MDNCYSGYGTATHCKTVAMQTDVVPDIKQAESTRTMGRNLYTCSMSVCSLICVAQVLARVGTLFLPARAYGALPDSPQSTASVLSPTRHARATLQRGANVRAESHAQGLICCSHLTAT